MTTANTGPGPATAADRLRLDALPADLKRRSLPELLTLTGSRVVVVGGAGRNLGGACSERLASLGADLVIIDRDENGARAKAAEVSDRWGGTAHAVAADVTDQARIAAAIETSVGLLGGIDVLVHNAGGSRIDGDSGGSFVDTSMDLHQAVVDLNLRGVMYTLHAVAPGMVAQGHGKIVLISSEAAKISLLHRVAYSAAKSGVVGLMRSLALELGPHGILINTVCPGTMVGEDLAERMRQTPADSPAVVPHLSTFDRIKLGRACHPEEVANVVAFLATDAASYVHGQAISVGGGMSE
jgi:3-oxoacyl-[acyl-carrier protein] reductase